MQHGVSDVCRLVPGCEAGDMGGGEAKGEACLVRHKGSGW